MITLFTIPKSFDNDEHVRLIQRNAVKSWLALVENVEVFFCGNDPGVEETAREFGVVHLNNIRTNEYGTPYVSDAFRQVSDRAKYDVLCYVNADIMFDSRLSTSIKAIAGQLEKFLVVGQRHDMEIEEEIEFHASATAKYLENYLPQKGELHPPYGIDYFIFPRGCFLSLPDLLVGRPCWDRYMLKYAKRNDIPVVDATGGILAVHQNHGYGHVPAARKKYEGPEGDQNRSATGNRLLDITNSDMKMEGDRKVLHNPRGLRTRLRETFIVWPDKHPLLNLAAKLYPILRSGLFFVQGSTKSK